MTETPTTLLCPSARNRAGALHLGVVNETGTVAFLGAPRRLTSSESAAWEKAGGDEVARFADPCLKTGCARWDGSCEVASTVADVVREVRPEADENALPICGIRPTCRWWHEQGAAACVGCAYVSTRQHAFDV